MRDPLRWPPEPRPIAELLFVLSAMAAGVLIVVLAVLTFMPSP